MIQPTVTDEEEATNTPSLLGCHLEDLEYNTVTKDDIQVGDEFYIVVKSEYASGQSMSIDLEDRAKDFEYNGVHMKDDIIRGIPIQGDITKVKVKAIATQNI